MTVNCPHSAFILLMHESVLHKELSSEGQRREPQEDRRNLLGRYLPGLIFLIDSYHILGVPCLGSPIYSVWKLTGDALEVIAGPSGAVVKACQKY